MKVKDLIHVLDKDSSIKIYNQNEFELYSGKALFDTFIVDLDFYNDTDECDLDMLSNVAKKYNVKLSSFDDYTVIFEGEYKNLLNLLIGNEFDIDKEECDFYIKNKEKSLLDCQIFHINPCSNSREEFLEIYVI